MIILTEIYKTYDCIYEHIPYKKSHAYRYVGVRKWATTAVVNHWRIINERILAYLCVINFVLCDIVSRDDDFFFPQCRNCIHTFCSLHVRRVRTLLLKRCVHSPNVTTGYVKSTHTRTQINAIPLVKKNSRGKIKWLHVAVIWMNEIRRL